VQSPELATAAAPPPQRDGCDPTLWEHVYHPNRLKVVGGCVTVTGTVMSVQPESDGDLHISVRLDPELNAHNGRGESAGMVVEPVCVGRNAHAACRGFRQAVTITRPGARVRVTGVHVRDTHHHWMEIHPVTSIIVIP
jgi:hypothetical protein